MEEMKKLFKPEYFNLAKQVKFLDMGDTDGKEVWHWGIAINDSIVCGCCGFIFPIEDIFKDWEEYGKEEHPNVEAPIEIYDYWVDIQEAIRGE